jgi:hypothetical protein
VERVREKHDLRLAKKCVTKWKRAARVRAILRRAERQFPRPLAGVHVAPAELDSRLLGGPGARSEKKPVFQDFKSVQERYSRAKAAFKQRADDQKAKEDAAWMPLDVFDKAARVFGPRAREEVEGWKSTPPGPLELSFKLCLLVSPRMISSSKMEDWGVWLANKFQDYSPEDEDCDTPSGVLLLQSGPVPSAAGNREKSAVLDVCVRMDAVPVDQAVDRLPDYSGATAFMLFVDYPFDVAHLRDCAAKFAEALLLRRSGKTPSVPAVILLCGEKASEDVCDGVQQIFQLEKLKAAGYLADYLVSSCVVRRGFVGCNAKVCLGSLLSLRLVFFFERNLIIRVDYPMDYSWRRHWTGSWTKRRSFLLLRSEVP